MSLSGSLPFKLIIIGELSAIVILIFWAIGGELIVDFGVVGSNAYMFWKSGNIKADTEYV